MGEDAAEVPAYGTMVQRATEWIREKVFSGEFGPGEHLRQDQIAVRLGQSRVPVREAFKILVTERVLVHAPNRGHFVAQLTIAEMADLCWLRETLEAEVARSSSAPSPETVDRLRELAVEMERLAGTDEQWRRVELDRAFHEALWGLASRPVLVEELRRVADRQAPYRAVLSRRSPNRDQDADAEHREIIHSLVEGDMPRFQALLALHILRARQLIVAMRESGEAES